MRWLGRRPYPPIFSHASAASTRSFRNPLAGPRRHLHHLHAAVKISRHRPAHSLKFFWILRSQHRQRHPTRQHPGRISLLQKQYRRHSRRTSHYRLFPAFHVTPPGFPLELYSAFSLLSAYLRGLIIVQRWRHPSCPCPRVRTGSAVRPYSPSGNRPSTPIRYLRPSPLVPST
jgi:hypothetical protein